jgi:molybdopterin-dependent oxidoreductase alpha subunit
VYGSGTASVILDDLARADLVMVIGANSASNHPRLITQLVHLRRRGGKVIVVNPLRELGLTRFRIPSDWRSLLFGSQIADLYLQPHVGADIALLKAMLKGLIEAGGVDEAFVAAHTSGWDAVQRDVEAVSWDTLVAACGVSRAEIDRAVGMLRGARRGILCWAMGLTHHAHGVDNILAVANVALARGWLGQPGAGLLPIRGHSNVQGVSSMGVAPALKTAFADRLTELYDLSLPDGPGQDTFSSMEAAHAGSVAAALILGGNLFAANPDRRWAGEALRRVGHTVYVTTKLNEGHLHGRGRTTLILPALARDEEGEAITQESMFNYVRLSDGGVPAVAGETRSEVAIVADLARRILPPGRFDWASLTDHAALRREIARCVPGWEGLAEIGTTRQEFQVAGRTFHEPAFATGDGKARFHLTPLPAFSVAPGESRLMTLRSEGQFNSVVYDEEDLYRGNRRRDVVMMNGDDARRLGLEEGDAVTVATEVGRLAVHVAIVDIPPSNLAIVPGGERHRAGPRRSRLTDPGLQVGRRADRERLTVVSTEHDHAAARRSPRTADRDVGDRHAVPLPVRTPAIRERCMSEPAREPTRWPGTAWASGFAAKAAPTSSWTWASASESRPPCRTRRGLPGTLPGRSPRRSRGRSPPPMRRPSWPVTRGPPRRPRAPWRRRCRP